MKRYFGNLLAVNAFAISITAHAEIAKEAPQAKAWFESIDKTQLTSIVAPVVVTVIESFSDDDLVNGTPKFRPISFKKCRQVSFFDCISPVNANFSVVLNDKKPIKGVQGVIALTGSDSVAYSTSEGFFLSGDGGKATVPVKMKTSDISKVNIKDLAEGLIASLGYDAVVFAVDGDYVLIGSTEHRLKRVNLQGLAIANSDTNWSISSIERKGASLLSLMNRAGPYGVFKQVASSRDKPPIKLGTKVILESK